MKIDRQAFLSLAMGMQLGGCYVTPATSGSAYPQQQRPMAPQPTTEAHAPTQECVAWTPAGECYQWAQATSHAPVQECVGWAPSGECVQWDNVGPTQECIGWTPTGECNRWEPYRE